VRVASRAWWRLWDGVLMVVMDTDCIARHAKFPRGLGPWRADSAAVGENWQPSWTTGRVDHGPGFAGWPGAAARPRPARPIMRSWRLGAWDAEAAPRPG
jgi:hypothetical protein